MEHCRPCSDDPSFSRVCLWINSKTGGSNGATMRFNPESNWGANAGLTIARRLLEPIKAKYPGNNLFFISCVGGPSRFSRKRWPPAVADD